MIFRWLSALPFSWLYALADLLSLLAGRVLGYRAKVVAQNLERSFPDTTPAERRAIALAFYRNLADVVIEVIKALRVQPEELARRVTVLNPEMLQEPIDRGQSIMVLAAHQCNWEWLMLGCRLRLKAPIVPVYQPLTNPSADALMLEIRSRFGGKPIPMQQTLREMVRTKNTPTIFGLVADQTPMANSEKYWTSFLNQETAFFTGPERLAQKLGMPVFFARMARTIRGHYQVDFVELSVEPSSGGFTLTEQYAHELDKAIRAKPADWLWSHKRWKHPRPLPQAE